MTAPTTSFPTVLRDYTNERLLRAFREAPPRIREAADDLSWEEVSRRVRGAGRWSVKEIIQHLADAEIIGAARLRLILAEDEGCGLPAYDQDRWASVLAYGDIAPHDVHAALALFETLRSTGARLLDRATPRDWLKVATHPEWGPMSLRQWLELYADHGERHLAQILESRQRMGKPQTMSLLIPDRLY